MKNLNQFGMLSGVVVILMIAVTGLFQLIAFGHWLGTYGIEPKPIDYKKQEAAKKAAKQSTATKSRRTDLKSARNKKDVENIVRAYLLKNPEVIVDAIQAYQEKQKNRETAQREQLLVRFKKQLLNAKHDVVWNDGGKIPVVEFFDYQCGYCKRVYAAVKKLKDENKNVRLVYKEYPILGPASTFAARASLASHRQGKYFEFHDALMTVQGRLSEKVVMQQAAKVGLDIFQLDKDMKDPKIQEAIDRNILLARQLSITGTPTLIFGDTLVPGAIPYRRMSQLVKQASKGCKLC